MNRRVFIGTLAGGLLAVPLAGGAQQAARKPSGIGVLLYLYPPDADPPQAFLHRLRDLGYVDGQGVVVDWRYAPQGKEDRLPDLAAELVRLQRAVVAAEGNVTGSSLLLAEMNGKRLELLKEAAPKISRVAVLWDPSSPFHRAMLANAV